jgi:hypothetical protein
MRIIHILTSFQTWRFSPKNNYLAVGSADSTIDFYEITAQGKLNRISYCKQVPGPVIQLDWSVCGVYIKVRNMFFFGLIGYKI